MKRRDFITTTTAITATTLLSGCNRKIDEYRSITTSKRVKTKIKLATSWPAKFPIMGEGVEYFADNVKAMSGGDIEIKIYSKNTLVPALGVFDATSAGQIDAFHSGPYYWKGKNSAFSLFSGYPFGQINSELSAWFMFGGGYELWRELYARYNLYPLLGGNTSVQMGGWFKKPIDSVEDLKGLKMRIPGLGGEVLAKMGVNPILLPAGEIGLALERGVLDATEWVGPALDIKMGFHKVAPYYYSGWHEPGSTLELTFNKRKWDKLPSEHKAIITIASQEMHSRMSFDFQAKNAEAISELEKYNIKIRKFSPNIMRVAKQKFDKVIEELSTQNRDFAKVYKSASTFLDKQKKWSDVGLKNYLDIRTILSQ